MKMKLTTGVGAAALAAVLTLALAAAGCSSAPDDAAIASAIQAGFFNDTDLKSTNLKVASQGGVVTLTGEVPSEGARYKAFKLALDTRGVTKVNDQMTVAVAQAAPAPQPAPAAPDPAPAPKSSPAPKKTAAKPAPAVEKTPPPPPLQQTAAPEPAPPAAPEPPKPVTVEVPAGTPLVVRMIDSIDTETNKAGESFRASLDAPITSAGQTVIPAGTDVTVEITEVKSAGRMAGRSELRLAITRMTFEGQTYALVSDKWEQVGKGEGAKTATKIGGGAAIGAVIGAIAGGGKGAAIGATVGAGAGTAASATKKGEQIRVESEQRINFKLEAPLTVTYMPGARKARAPR